MIIDFITYLFCRIFKVCRCKKYFVLNDNLIQIRKIQPTLNETIKLNGNLYKVLEIINEVKNDTLVYIYIYISKI